MTAARILAALLDCADRNRMPLTVRQVHALAAAAADALPKPRPAEDPPSGDRTGPGRPLTRRQWDCLLWAGRGLTNDRIAAELGIAESTVKHHLGGASRTLGVHTSRAAVDEARRRGLITDADLRGGEAAA